MHSTPETREAASKVVEYIEAYPDRHNQSSWVAIFDELGEEIEVHDPEEVSLCKTTMCVAGTAAFQRYGTVVFTDTWQRDHTWMEEGQTILGLNFIEANYLFYDTDNDEALKVVRGLAVGEWNGEDLTEL